MPRDLTGDDPQQRATVVGGEQRDVAGADVLIPGGNPLLRRGQIDPQLEAVEETAAGDQLLGWTLDVQNARAGGRPLSVAVGDQPAPTVRVLVLEGAVDHVRDRLEAAMRMPRRALGFAGLVLHLTHLIHVDERIDHRGVRPREGAAHREAFALESVGRCGDTDHRTVGRRGRVGLRDVRQGGDVGNGHSWHGEIPYRASAFTGAITCSRSQLTPGTSMYSSISLPSGSVM